MPAIARATSDRHRPLLLPVAYHRDGWWRPAARGGGPGRGGTPRSARSGASRVCAAATRRTGPGSPRQHRSPAGGPLRGPRSQWRLARSTATAPTHRSRAVIADASTSVSTAVSSVARSTSSRSRVAAWSTTDRWSRARPNSVALTWRAPGVDGGTGSLSKGWLRFGTSTCRFRRANAGRDGPRRPRLVPAVHLGWVHDRTRWRSVPVLRPACCSTSATATSAELDERLFVTLEW
jgi:hypothetical protein